MTDFFHTDHDRQHLCLPGRDRLSLGLHVETVRAANTVLGDGSCLDETSVLQFVDGALPSAARVEVRAHVASCRACAELAIWVAADIANGDDNLGREGSPFIGQLAPGSRLARYEVLRSIARGAMGEVYEARDTALGRHVAIKVAVAGSRVGAQIADAQARLLHEAKTLARLSHPNVVAIHDVGHAGPGMFIAMQFLEGQTLKNWLRTRRSWRRILNAFLAAGRGLAAAHAANIVHCDFKPQNVMIGNDGAVRLLDFSLARFTGHASALNNGGVTVSGTPRYMAPEQVRGGLAHERTDQFSFCVSLRHALCGAPRRGRGLRPCAPREVPPRVLRALRRGTSPDPSDRFQSMEQLLAHLSA